MSALLEALGSDSLLGAMITTETRDSELESYGDAARWAAIAAGGGTWALMSEETVYEEEVVRWDFSSSDVRERQRGFWEWWLQQAIPQAIQAAHTNGSAP